MHPSNGDVARPPQERVLQVASTVAVIVLFFGTALGGWGPFIVAAGALVGLLLYAVFTLPKAEQTRLVGMTIAAALIAGAIGVVVAALI